LIRDYISEKHAGMPENEEENLSFWGVATFLDDPYIPDTLREAIFKGFESLIHIDMLVDKHKDKAINKHPGKMNTKGKKSSGALGLHGPLQQMLLDAREAFIKENPKKSTTFSAIMTFVHEKFHELKDKLAKDWPDYLNFMKKVKKVLIEVKEDELCLWIKGMEPKKWKYVSKEYYRIIPKISP
jgi:predicted ATPase